MSGGPFFTPHVSFWRKKIHFAHRSVCLFFYLKKSTLLTTHPLQMSSQLSIPRSPYTSPATAVPLLPYLDSPSDSFVPLLGCFFRILYCHSPLFCSFFSLTHHHRHPYPLALICATTRLFFLILYCHSPLLFLSSLHSSPPSPLPHLTPLTHLYPSSAVFCSAAVPAPISFDLSFGFHNNHF